MVSNTLIDNIKDGITELLAGINQIAIGTGIAPTEESTVLTGELLRKNISESFDFDGTKVYEIFLDETEANDVHITNTGLFDDAELLAGAGIDVQKTNRQSLTISYEITINVEVI